MRVPAPLTLVRSHANAATRQGGGAPGRRLPYLASIPTLALPRASGLPALAGVACWRLDLGAGGRVTAHECQWKTARSDRSRGSELGEDSREPAMPAVLWR